MTLNNLNFKRLMRIVIPLAIIFVVAIWAWNRYFAPTSIAFVNYQVLTLSQISRANDNSFIRIHELSTDDIDRIGGYDMVFINGMGLRITEEQREKIIDAANGGTSVLTTAATNPDNYIVSVDSLVQADLREYLSNGGRRNYRSMLNYVRGRIDRKRVSVGVVDSVQRAADDMLYHMSMRNPDDEMGFNTVAEYDAFLNDNGLLPGSDAPRLVVCGQMADPADMVAAFEDAGFVVYPVRDIASFIGGGHIDSVAPSAIVNMAHGRLGDDIVDYLEQADIPLFAPLNVNCLESRWLDDKSGMSGGFMAQSIVMPEIDGSLRPYALFAHDVDADGVPRAVTMPQRLHTFVSTVSNYVRLQRTDNSQKRVAVYYFKGPGQSALSASGMEVVPSLYNFLCRLKEEGYDVSGLPADKIAFEKLIMERGPVFGTYAEGSIAEFIKSGYPELIAPSQYGKWIDEAIQSDAYQEVVAEHGEFPGNFMVVADSLLAVARIKLGNIVLIPQTAAGGGDNTFSMVHGTESAPPHSYIAPYLWARYDFGADAIVHFGTHGSLEYTPRKQVALSSGDWSDCLIGDVPHVYLYTIGNVGESLIAKRRSYAAINSHLTPPFMESGIRGDYNKLSEAIKHYNSLLSDDAGTVTDDMLANAAKSVKLATGQLGINRELALDSAVDYVYTADDIARVEQFAEELAAEKVTGKLYILGEPYSNDCIESSVYSMTTDPIAYGLLALDKLRGLDVSGVERHKSLFASRYLEPARAAVARILANPSAAGDALVCRLARISPDTLELARSIDAVRSAPKDMMSMMMSMRRADGLMPVSRGKAVPVNRQRREDAMKERMAAMAKYVSPEKAMYMAKMMGADEKALKKMRRAMAGSTPAPNDSTYAVSGAARPHYTKADIEMAEAIMSVERAVLNVNRYRQALKDSPEAELSALINGLAGGFISPSPGGDPIVNPNTLPTGRNLYGINAEATPGEAAWEKGIRLAENTIKMYRQRHNDSIPRKVSYTLWSGEFIETEGATIAQILYMLGVEPVRDAFGRVTDLRLVPSEELGRPRIDVVVQTSGQFRDLAASRLFLINRAVEMAAAASDDIYPNQVAEGVVASERILIDKGLSPKEAREVSFYRVFGGVNGNYGTGIQSMVQAGDKWTDESEIAAVYLNNMGAFYGNEKNWEKVKANAFEAALANTDAVVQPRQSNTWGALSLDHVYEFMGGLNLAVRNVTGKDPDAYLSDYRNHNNMRMQEVKEAIGVESRTTIFNPAYISEKMKGGASSAAEFTSAVENTYGWNVMKPAAIDDEVWNEIYRVYVCDEHRLGIKKFFETHNPSALQDMSAVMMEASRKGLWKASGQQLADIARLHTELVEKHGASGSAVVADNVELRKFIASKVDEPTADSYNRAVERVRSSAVGAADNAMVMERHNLSAQCSDDVNNSLNGYVVVGLGILGFMVLIFVVRRRRRS